MIYPSKPKLLHYSVFSSASSRDLECPLPEVSGDAQLPSQEQPLAEAEQLDDAEQEGAEEAQAEPVLQHHGAARQLRAGSHREGARYGWAGIC